MCPDGRCLRTHQVPPAALRNVSFPALRGFQRQWLGIRSPGRLPFRKRQHPHSEVVAPSRWKKRFLRAPVAFLSCQPPVVMSCHPASKSRWASHLTSTAMRAFSSSKTGELPSRWLVGRANFVQGASGHGAVGQEYPQTLDSAVFSGHWLDETKLAGLIAVRPLQLAAAPAERGPGSFQGPGGL